MDQRPIFGAVENVGPCPKLDGDYSGDITRADPCQTAEHEAKSTLFLYVLSTTWKEARPLVIGCSPQTSHRAGDERSSELARASEQHLHMGPEPLPLLAFIVRWPGSPYPPRLREAWYPGPDISDRVAAVATLARDLRAAQVADR